MTSDSTVFFNPSMLRDCLGRERARKTERNSSGVTMFDVQTPLTSIIIVPLPWIPRLKCPPSPFKLVSATWTVQGRADCCARCPTSASFWLISSPLVDQDPARTLQGAQGALAGIIDGRALGALEVPALAVS